MWANQGMDFKVSEKNNATIVQINGELDVANAMELSDYLTGLFKKFPKRVILNLETVNYIASSGLAMLVAALKKVPRDPGPVRDLRSLASWPVRRSR